MKCRARSTRFAFGIPVNSSWKATLSVTLRQGKVDSSWNTMPIAWCGPAMVSPATLTTPAWWVSRRSEERRVGKECRSRWWREHGRKKGGEEEGGGGVE